MERILLHYAPHLSLDIQSLRQAADTLTAATAAAAATATAPSTATQHSGLADEFNAPSELELEDLAIDDEDFTIEALPDKHATRTCVFRCCLVLSCRSALTGWPKTTRASSPTATSR